MLHPENSGWSKVEQVERPASLKPAPPPPPSRREVVGWSSGAGTEIEGGAKSVVEQVSKIDDRLDCRARQFAAVVPVDGSHSFASPAARRAVKMRLVSMQPVPGTRFYLFRPVTA